MYIGFLFVINPCLSCVGLQDPVRYSFSGTLKLIEEHLISLGKGTAQPCISMEKLKSLKIPIPSLEKQKEIVAYCDANNNLIKQLENEIENNKNLAQQFIKGIVKNVLEDEEEAF